MKQYRDSLHNCGLCKNKWINPVNDSGEFQEVESNHSGRLSHVPSQPEVIPSASSMLSRDKRLPSDTWNTLGLQENVFGNQFSTFDSSRNPSQGIHHAWCRTWSTKRDRISSTTNRNRDLLQEMTSKIRAQFQCRCLRFPVQVSTGRLVAKGEEQIWSTVPRPSFARRPSTMNSLLLAEGFKTQVRSCSDFPSEAKLWIKEVEMVDSVDE